MKSLPPASAMRSRFLVAALLVSAASALRPQTLRTRAPTRRAGFFDALVGGDPADDIRAKEKVLPGRWRLSFALPGYDTRKNVIAEFDDLLGYEPPQGELVLVDAEGARRRAGSWKLSEDPEDKKDGLWVWGLFEEPLYPFLLLSLDSEQIGLPSGGRLQVQMGHKARPGEDQQLLGAGSVAVRQKEIYEADRMGISKAVLDIDTAIGTVSAQPVRNDERGAAEPEPGATPLAAAAEATEA